MANQSDPIRHVVHLILENRSFDQMLGCLREIYPDLDGINPNALRSNKDTGGHTTSGAGAARRTHILVKPSAVGLSTNLVIATDRRVYHVEARSNARTAMASIAWTYPDDALLALRGTVPPEGDPVSAGVAVDQLNFDYRIDGDNVPWRPIRAFDDGRQVFIEFPPTLPDGEAPPLFVSGDKGRAELVNYRIRGRYYVVDHLFAAAELRMGEKHQQVVQILRGIPDDRQGGRAR